MTRIAIVLGMLAAVPGCGGGGGGGGGGGDSCAVEAEASFSANVVPLIEDRCALPQCHGSRPQAGLSLDGSDADIHAMLVSATSVTAPDLARVEPGDPDASFLIHKVQGDFTGLACADDDCGVRMPKADDPLSAECLDMLTAWVQAGAPNN